MGGGDLSGVDKSRLPAVETAKERSWVFGTTVLMSDSWESPRLVVGYTPKFLILKATEPGYQRYRLRSLPVDVREHREED